MINNISTAYKRIIKSIDSLQIFGINKTYHFLNHICLLYTWSLYFHGFSVVVTDVATVAGLSESVPPEVNDTAENYKKLLIT